MNRAHASDAVRRLDIAQPAKGQPSRRVILAALLGNGAIAVTKALAAFVTGVLYNIVAYRTRSLISCILAHATTNLLLGLWIMHTYQWGFW